VICLPDLASNSFVHVSEESENLLHCVISSWLHPLELGSVLSFSLYVLPRLMVWEVYVMNIPPWLHLLVGIHHVIVIMPRIGFLTCISHALYLTRFPLYVQNLLREVKPLSASLRVRKYMYYVTFSLFVWPDGNTFFFHYRLGMYPLMCRLHLVSCAVWDLAKL
jgi:hypothetical protein